MNQIRLFAFVLMLSSTGLNLAVAEVDRAALQQALAALPRLEWGRKLDQFQVIEEATVASPGNEPLRRTLEIGLLAVIRGDSTRAAKDYACRQLSFVGGGEAAAALGGLLTSPELSHMARYALERISVPSAAVALREALRRTSGNIKAGIINSLGRKSDAASAPLLVAALQDSSAEVVAAAALALGRIATPDAVRALREFQETAPAQLQNAAADGYLEAAQTLMKRGDHEVAARIYGQFYSGGTSPSLRIAAFEGLALASPGEANTLLLEALKGKDPTLRNTASRLIEAWPGRQTPKPLLDALPTLPAEGQIALLSAIKIRQDVSTRPAVLSLTESLWPEVRLAALGAMGAVGTAADVTLLARAAAGADKAWQQAARASLASLGGQDVNPAIIAALPVAEPVIRAELLRSLGARSVNEAAVLASKYLQDPNAQVRQAAIATLGELHDEKQIPALVKILVSAPADADRDAAEQAIGTLCLKTTGNVTDSLVAGMNDADLNGKTALLRILKSVGDAKSLAVIRQASADADPQIRDAAIRTLAEWEDPAAAKDLLPIARAADNSLHRALAFSGYIRLVRDADLKGDERLAMISAAAEIARTVDEKKLLIAALSDVYSVDSLKMVAPYLEVPELADEASAAAVGIAGRANNLPKATAGEVLNKVVAVVRNPSLRDAALKLMQRLGLTLDSASKP